MTSFRKRGDKWEYRIPILDRQTGKYKYKTKGGFSQHFKTFRIISGHYYVKAHSEFHIILHGDVRFVKLFTRLKIIFLK